MFPSVLVTKKPWAKKAELKIKYFEAKPKTKSRFSFPPKERITYTRESPKTDPDLIKLLLPTNKRVHTVSFDWFLSGLEWILNMEFCLLKLLIFYQKLLWNIRSRLNSSTFLVFEPVFKYVWSKSSFFVHKASILIKHI